MISIYDEQHCKFAVPQAYYAVHLNEFSMMPHTHNRCEIMYITSGECKITVEKNIYILKERQFIFLNQNVLHCLTIEKNVPCTILNLEFACNPRGNGVNVDELGYNSTIFKKFLQAKKDIILATDDNKMGYALKDLIGELNNRNNSDDYLLNLLFSRMMIEIAKCSIINHNFTGSIHLEKSINYIKDNIFDNLSVKQVANHVGITPAYLKTLFSKNMGCGIVSYINKQKMDYASFLLKNSNISVIDIAIKLGYNSRQHFSYLFNKHFGISPKYFRKISAQNLIIETERDYLKINNIK